MASTTYVQGTGARRIHAVAKGESGELPGELPWALVFDTAAVCGAMVTISGGTVLWSPEQLGWFACRRCLRLVANRQAQPEGA